MFNAFHVTNNEYNVYLLSFCIFISTWQDDFIWINVINEAGQKQSKGNKYVILLHCLKGVM